MGRPKPTPSILFVFFLVRGQIKIQIQTNSSRAAAYTIHSQIGMYKDHTPLEPPNGAHLQSANDQNLYHKPDPNSSVPLHSFPSFVT
uniref:Uncharacterized protein n=1 Tax=Cucumis melo TaxID=3656 RepID=A0A9I9EF72_CUCME